VCRSKHVEPTINFGIINSITKLHFVGISTEISSNIEFLNDRSGGTQIVPRARTDVQTDMTKLIAAFRRFANSP
jgi:hypothetical protein